MGLFNSELKFKIVVVALLLNLAVQVMAKSIFGNRILIYSSNSDSNSYSKFYDLLKVHDYEIKLERSDSMDFELFDYGERKYDHLVLLAPKKLEKGVNPRKVIEFVEQGGNLMVALNANQVHSSVSELLYQIGIEIAGSSVLEDDFNSFNGNVSMILSKQFTEYDAFLSQNFRSTSAPILYQGFGLQIHSKLNPLITPLLSANPTTRTGSVASPGSVELVTTLQSKSNARVSIFGSSDMFTNRFLNSKLSYETGERSPGNLDFIDEVLQWTFHEKSVIFIERSTHHKKGLSNQQKMYRIKDHIEYSIVLKEWVGSSFVPHLADSSLQFVAKMLDPYVRQPLSLNFTTATEATYELAVQLPDVYGVFTFLTEYHRPGYTYLDHSELVSIRPFRHDEFPRFLSVAYPYYSSVFSQMVAFIVFCWIWLTHRASYGVSEADKEINANDAVESKLKPDALEVETESMGNKEAITESPRNSQVRRRNKK